ncbi:MAG TPA: YihY/virulence factor BrkB family protein, partial [Nannocystis sp.]
LIGLLFILVLGGAVVALLVVGSIVSALAALPGAAGLSWVWQVINVVGALVVMTGMFAALFKLVPTTRMPWRSVVVGAIATSLLFVVGRGVIALYIGRVGVGSAYGAAGSVIVLMVWIYYSALIVLLGAEITEIHARRTGGDHGDPRASDGRWSGAHGRGRALTGSRRRRRVVRWAGGGSALRAGRAIDHHGRGRGSERGEFALRGLSIAGVATGAVVVVGAARGVFDPHPRGGERGDDGGDHGGGRAARRCRADR